MATLEHTPHSLPGPTSPFNNGTNVCRRPRPIKNSYLEICLANLPVGLPKIVGPVWWRILEPDGGPWRFSALLPRMYFVVISPHPSSLVPLVTISNREYSQLPYSEPLVCCSLHRRRCHSSSTMRNWTLLLLLASSTMHSLLIPHYTLAYYNASCVKKCLGLHKSLNFGSQVFPVPMVIPKRLSLMPHRNPGSNLASAQVARCSLCSKS